MFVCVYVRKKVSYVALIGEAGLSFKDFFSKLFIGRNFYLIITKLCTLVALIKIQILFKNQTYMTLIEVARLSSKEKALAR